MSQKLVKQFSGFLVLVVAFSIGIGFTFLLQYDTRSEISKDNILVSLSPDSIDFPSYEMPVNKDAELVDLGADPVHDFPCGKKWFALFQVGKEFEIRPAGFRARSKKSGLKALPVFTFRNIPSLFEGSVKTSFYKPFPFDGFPESNDSPSIEYLRTFNLDDKVYTLKVILVVRDDGNTNSTLFLESGNESQVINSERYYEDFPPSLGNLIWAGDLDHDSKLDLYFGDFARNGGGFETRLFLSADASQGKLVGYSAAFPGPDTECR